MKAHAHETTHVCEACGKVAYRGRMHAQIVAKLCSDRGEPLRVYACAKGVWHLTAAPTYQKFSDYRKQRRPKHAR